MTIKFYYFNKSENNKKNLKYVFSLRLLKQEVRERKNIELGGHIIKDKKIKIIIRIFFNKDNQSIKFTNQFREEIKSSSIFL